MNCQSFENVVIDLAQQQIVEADLREQALRHSNECKPCASRLEDQRMLTHELGALAAGMKALNPSDKVEAHLVAAFREGKTLPEIQHSASRWPYLVTSAAAVLLVAMGIVGWQLFQSRPSTDVASAVTPIQEKLPTKLTSPGLSIGRPVIHMMRPKPTSNQRALKRRPKKDVIPSRDISPAIATSESQEVATAFMPLGDASVANLQDGAQVIRVELPRYLMARFGLPVNMERYDERVKADVWVGADGLARAIRFVQ